MRPEHCLAFLLPDVLLEFPQLVCHPVEGFPELDLPPCNQSRSSVRILGGRRRQDADHAVPHGRDFQPAAAG